MLKVDFHRTVGRGLNKRVWMARSRGVEINMPEALPILLALIAVVGSLGGVWLGRYLERDNEALNWRRDRCLEAYTDVLRACDLLYFEVHNLYHERSAKEAVASEARLAEMYRLGDRAILLGSDDFRKSIEALMNYYSSARTRVLKSPKASADEWNQIEGYGASLYAKVLVEAQKDLGNPARSRRNWKFAGLRRRQ